jgi:hypothetical protein
MIGLPIVKMTLYKHGVGFYLRRGAVKEGAVSLSFDKDEMNDVLKSLTAVARGGQVLGVDYDTPEDKAERLARSSIQLSDEASLRDLLRDLRGRRVEVVTPSGRQVGLVVGVDLPGEREPMAAGLLSLFLPAEQRVQPVRMGELSELALLDERAAGDLGYFLETSLTEENKRAVTIRLAPTATDLSISYIAASPVWRVSYRLVVAEVGGADDRGKGLLQGWGLFDNTLDEDLEDVALTFVSGMPVSFIYDLYTPFTPQRPVITEQGRAAAGPIEFEGAVGAGLARSAPVRSMLRAAAADADLRGLEESLPLMGAEAIAASTAVAAAGRAQGEFFSYVVGSPVTVRRGRSAMVPILQSSLELGKERIYNGRKQPRNPVITARFKNDTGLTLERGPLTVIEAGEYAGDALVPFTAPGGDIVLAYAVDLGATIRETPESARALTSVGVKEGMLVIEEYDIQKTVYQVENRNEQAVRITLEHPRLAHYAPFETPDPVESTADYHRYAVQAPGHGSVSFTVQQRRLLYRREEIRNQKLEQLVRWLRDKVLDEQVYDRLRGILALYDQITNREAGLKKNEAARQEVFSQQRVIQGNLGALKDTGEEGQLRARYARTLQELEDRLVALRLDDEALRNAIDATKQEIDAALKAL